MSNKRSITGLSVGNNPSGPSFTPLLDDSTDLGSSSKRFKSGYFAGEVNSNSLSTGSITATTGSFSEVVNFDSAPILASLGSSSLIGTDGSSQIIDYTLTGTSHQVGVSLGSGFIILSTPQNLDTTSSVTFGSITSGQASFSEVTSTGAITTPEIFSVSQVGLVSGMGVVNITPGSGK